MGRGKHLSEFELGQINALKGEGYSERDIAMKINRSKTAVHNYLDNPEGYGKAPRSGRPKSLSERDSRHALRLLSNQVTSCSAVKRELGFECHRSTLYRAARQAENLEFTKGIGKPPLTSEHKEKRLEFARNHVDYGDKWFNVMFSDEKKFNLDGPDGFHYYWHDLRKDDLIFSKRQFGGGNCMVWAGISFNGNTLISFTSNRMNSEDYQEVLNEFMLPVIHEYCGSEAEFQQDNASIHSSKSTKNWLRDNRINVMEWPARSPDLNPIENAWADLSRNVYRNGRQFRSIPELKSAIESEWSKLDQTKIQNLILSMKDRLVEVIENHGGTTHY